MLCNILLCHIIVMTIYRPSRNGPRFREYMKKKKRRAFKQAPFLLCAHFVNVVFLKTKKPSLLQNPITSFPSSTHWDCGRCWCRSLCCLRRRPLDSHLSVLSEDWGHASSHQSQTRSRAPGQRRAGLTLQYRCIHAPLYAAVTKKPPLNSFTGVLPQTLHVCL